MTQWNTTLFLFRRDLRLQDNTGLIFALKNSKQVIPAFIFTPEQIERNPYRSDPCLAFMLESLEELDQELKAQGSRLCLFQGKVEEVLEQCLTHLSIDAIIVNRDYTPYSLKRDKTIEKICHKHHLPFHSFDDALLHPPEETLKQDGTPYSIFTPYFRNASKLEILPPTPNRNHNYFKGKIPFAKGASILTSLNPPLHGSGYLPGGRTEALKRLKNLTSFANYKEKRDFPAETHSITQLSPYLKFTLCSPREVYAALAKQLGPHHDLIRSLYWRDFFTGIAFFFPHVFKGAFHQKFDQLDWSYDKKSFQRWCEGNTGFPIVDAGMRELNETGFMHNRVRMITASFLIKDLHIDWRWGEKYFAQTLIDYDPAVNNGNWQWVASTGCDAQPYFRIFNPWNQQKKFDPKCEYIHRWIPKLRTLSPTLIHQWENPKYHPECPHYPPPMVSHETESKRALLIYRAIKS